MLSIVKKLSPWIVTQDFDLAGKVVQSTLVDVEVEIDGQLQKLTMQIGPEFWQLMGGV